MPGLHELIDRFDGFLIDLWGVMHNGTAPYDGALAALAALRAAGKKVAFVSNSSSIVAPVAAQLRAMGITDYDALITSGALVAAALRDETALWRPGLRGQALLVGDATILAQYDAPLTLVNQPEQAGLIVNAWYGNDQDDPAAWQDTMRSWLALGLPMICSNPDYDVVLQHGRLLCPGAFAAAYEALGGTVHYYGKPYAAAYRAGIAALGLPATARLAMIGDNLLTDIRGGQETGLATILILGGVHRAALGAAWGDAPPPAALQALWQNFQRAPDYAIPAFRL